MDFIQVLVLSVVQGITEFLPISSSAHLIFLPHFFGWRDQGLIFDIAVHVGTLGAVMFYFRHEVGILARGTFDVITLSWDEPDGRLLVNLLISVIPIAVFGLFVADLVASGGRSFVVLGTTSIIFGVLLGYADRIPEKCVTIKKLEDLSAKNALTFGLFQALAIIPGTSRSGICMTAGRLIGCNREIANRFASLMAIPTIALAFIYSLMHVELADVTAINWSEEWRILGIALLLSFFTAMIGIHLLMTWVKKIGYMPFVIYRVILGVVLIGIAFI